MTGYFFHDLRREVDERTDFHRRPKERRNMIENLQARKGVAKTADRIAGSYGKYNHIQH